ncbi:hypothetical protein K461DRAFT_276594 [Myriangium duriaei CBS 260.36]|uniref:Uncharacterized protein n=1 Tax=Myriangium duriaei CBS 260.36 TaxID=1168546 RepID=A0A9P4J931_9PEZI|nr:hypothetical protein K461DRAFT_276594 [Myriangium duriaei CBS 260.36]
MAPHGDHDENYHPKDAVGGALRATMITAGAGAFVSTIQNTLTRQNRGAMGFLTKTGGTIAVFGAMGGAYEFAKLASANLREKDDIWNPTIGGFFSGTMLGLRFRTMPAVVGYGALTAVVLGAFNYTGGKMSGWDRDADMDEYDRKQMLRRSRRRPVEDTIAEIGEGRGIYGEGYAERRAQLLKEKYGIEVPSSTRA